MKNFGINVVLSDEQVEQIASKAADKVLHSSKFDNTNYDWYEREIKDLKTMIQKRDELIVSTELRTDLWRNRLVKKTETLKKYEGRDKQLIDILNNHLDSKVINKSESEMTEKVTNLLINILSKPIEAFVLQNEEEN